MLSELSKFKLYTSKGLSPLRRAILVSMAYADIFDYPLTAREIHRYCGMKTSLNKVYAEIRDFRLISKTGNFYTIPGRENLVEVRIQREQASARLWFHAIRYGHIIANLPFVRMAAVTGSLAVNNADEGGDIDFLIVTEPGRLWTSRAMVLALDRLADRQGVRLCPNYLVTTRALEFSDHNLYVAHEIAQMVLLSGLDVYHEIRRKNGWVLDYLPNADHLPLVPAPVKLTKSKPQLHSVFEALGRTPPADWFERWEMKRKIRRLSHEQGSSNESVFTADICKGHDQRYQSRTRQLLDSKVTRLLKEYSYEGSKPSHG